MKTTTITGERINQLFSFTAPDRFPALEWGPWWNKSVERWIKSDGLDQTLPHLRWAQPGMEIVSGKAELGDVLGLDPFRVLWLGIEAEGCPQPAGEGLGIIADMDEYLAVKPYLYQKPVWAIDYLHKLQLLRQEQDMALWMWVDGFFWGPRKLLGIERHLFAFYDQEELLLTINQDIVDYYQRVLPELFDLVTPDILLVAEDLSYNHGPMLSKDKFEAICAPYYRQLIPLVKSYGIHPLMDSDGDIEPIIPWLRAVGIEGLAPLERMAGVDLNKIRRQYPDFLLIGGFDKTVIGRGEAAMRCEFERLLPVIQSGGYLPTPDHQTPPDVSLADYALFRKLFREYTDGALTTMKEGKK